jgi:uncharacterized membrane protein YjjB (DUF3815 family)
MRPSSTTAKSSTERTSGIPSHPDSSALILCVVFGAALGIGLGFFSMAGTMAVIIGAVLGAVAGGVVGKLTLSRQHRQSAKDKVFDRETGVIP